MPVENPRQEQDFQEDFSFLHCLVHVVGLETPKNAIQRRQNSIELNQKRVENSHFYSTGKKNGIDIFVPYPPEMAKRTKKITQRDLRTVERSFPRQRRALLIFEGTQHQKQLPWIPKRLPK